MENNKTPDGFSYTYSAGEQAEIKKIRDKYTAPTEKEDKMARLRRLDATTGRTSSGASSFPKASAMRPRIDWRGCLRIIVRS